MSQGQQQAQFGMWALMASPLFMSVDLRNIDVAAKDILLNQLVLDINQDPLGIQGKRVWRVPGPVSKLLCYENVQYILIYSVISIFVTWKSEYFTEVYVIL